jgi:hypothetical protein
MAMEIVFILLMLLLVIQGFICAFHLNKRYSFLLRTAVLLPVLTALFTLHCFVSNSYEIFPADLLRAVATNGVYVVILGHLLKKSWVCPK